MHSKDLLTVNCTRRASAADEKSDERIEETMYEQRICPFGGRRFGQTADLEGEISAGRRLSKTSSHDASRASEPWRLRERRSSSS